jgi:hypothetical protein
LRDAARRWIRTQNRTFHAAADVIHEKERGTDEL